MIISISQGELDQSLAQVEHGMHIQLLQLEICILQFRVVYLILLWSIVTL